MFYNNANVKQIDVPSFSGSFGILPQHVPLLAVLKPGVITVHEQDGNQKKYFGNYMAGCIIKLFLSHGLSYIYPDDYSCDGILSHDFSVKIKSKNMLIPL